MKAARPARQLGLSGAAARHARMRRSPELQCESGQPALDRPTKIANASKRAYIPRNLQMDETVWWQVS